MKIEREYDIGPKFKIFEVKKFRSKNKVGNCTMVEDEIYIYVLSSLSDAEKVLTIIHEVTHFIQFIEQNGFEDKLPEKKRKKIGEYVAIKMEELFFKLLKNLPFFFRGITELWQSDHEKFGEIWGGKDAERLLGH